MQKGIRFFPGQRYLIGPDGYVRVWTEHLARRPDMAEFIPQEPLYQANAAQDTQAESSGVRYHNTPPNRHEARRQQLKTLMRAARLRRADIARICGVPVWTVIAWLRRADAPARRTIPEPALRLFQLYAERHE
jgi:hypothetical protein